MDYADRGKLGIVYGDVTLGVHGEDFHLIFSYQTGGLESMVKHGKEWLYRTPKPTFWRATTDNDRGNGFPFRAIQSMKCSQSLHFHQVIEYPNVQ